VFVELKASHRSLEASYRDNLRDYKDTISHLFPYNGIVILSNGREAKIGSITAEYEHFADWKRISDEKEQGIISLDTMIQGVCAPERLLDILENFLLYMQTKGGLAKITAKNHQYLGVNNAIQNLQVIRATANSNQQGRLGVFWHTQGSGKSLSMVAFSQKVLRKLPGNWTFLIVTDRDDLDTQIYKNFANCGIVTDLDAQANSAADLRALLSQNHRYIFTLIQKFRTERGERHPVLSERDNIIVIVDEAHRSQYDTFALNMRTALPNAAFIAFTGTPLIKGEDEATRDVFGDYVSVYNFHQSVEDKATVPLYYEGRIPELQLTNLNLSQDIEAIIESAELDENQQEKLERHFGREYQILTRDDRLERVAEDLVLHFMGRGYKGKAMMICIDKATAVRVYNKVKKHWELYLQKLRARIEVAKTEVERQALSEQIMDMQEMDMAVIVSQSQNEIADLRERGLDILPHRKRMQDEDLEELFKDPKGKLRLVFVCTMWITGFDVPTCSTIYLDKPMRGHTLMQTIARANRVAPGKESGLIVDYVGIFRRLEQALAIYGPGREANAGENGSGENALPIESKDKQVDRLRVALGEIQEFCASLGINIQTILSAQGMERERLKYDAVDALVARDDIRRKYLVMSSQVVRLHKDIKPHLAANELLPDVVIYSVLAQSIRALLPPADISAVMEQIDDILDASIAAEGYVIQQGEGEKAKRINLSEIDFTALQEKFKAGHKNTATQELRTAVEEKITELVEKNRGRMDFLEKFQRLIEEYNSGSMNVERLFEELIRISALLNEEEKRAIKNELTEEELAVFDLLTQPEPKLDEKEQKQVKIVAKRLVQVIEGLGLRDDWKNRQQIRAEIKVKIENAMDEGLPDIYDRTLFSRKAEMIYQHVFEVY
jgi:type I restriction enzyme, R subunit